MRNEASYEADWLESHSQCTVSKASPSHHRPLQQQLCSCKIIAARGGCPEEVGKQLVNPNEPINGSLW